jgi:hypothetical protein
MRPFLIGALCAALIGCSCPLPPRGVVQTCTSQGCFTRTAATTPIEPKRAPFKSEPARKGAMTAKPTAAKPRNETEPVEEKANSRTTKEPATTGGKTEGPASDQPSEASDPVLKKAKTTVAAKMEDPASAEFVDMKRVMKKNTFGQPFEIICGHVKGKKTSGEATGERPFLYLVKEDEAFIVDGNPNSVAAIAYRAHCTSQNSH